MPRVLEIKRKETGGVDADFACRCLDDSLCQEDEFRCNYGPCLKKHMLCDGHANCSDWDLSDELNCGT